MNKFPTCYSKSMATNGQGSAHGFKFPLSLYEALVVSLGFRPRCLCTRRSLVFNIGSFRNSPPIRDRRSCSSCSLLIQDKACTSLGSFAENMPLHIRKRSARSVSSNNRSLARSHPSYQDCALFSNLDPDEFTLSAVVDACARCALTATSAPV